MSIEVKAVIEVAAAIEAKGTIEAQGGIEAAAIAARSGRRTARGGNGTRRERITPLHASVHYGSLKKATATAPGPTCVPMVAPTMSVGMLSSAMLPSHTERLSFTYLRSNLSDRPE